MTRESVAVEPGGEMLPLLAFGMTHTGKRARNEDRYLIREDLGLVIVADGFGGAAGGDVAARTAVEEISGCFGAECAEQTIPNLDPEELSDGLTVATVRFAIEHAHARIRYQARRTGPLGMSTAVAVLVVAGSQVVIGHAGSVHVYRFRADLLERLTNDDPTEARLACPVGAADDATHAVVRAEVWKPGDRYLLCTSGLHRALGAEPIRCTLAMPGTEEERAAALVGRALSAGAADNMTAVLAFLQPARRGQSPDLDPGEGERGPVTVRLGKLGTGGALPL